ncbi:MAG: ATP-binding protein [Candidatus Marinimicrobia bacterium]|nr:ATP-binding protein [Candidatus Neomarinimicrobiota bacterium]
MALLSGPRQAGKTTCAKTLDNSYTYINWDNKNDREKILKGPDTIISAYNLNTIEDRNKLLIFDELHKYSKWKQFIKGFFDVYSDKYKILITGSARLNIYKKIGDSLMGRYFNYRLHPLSIAEIQNTNLRESEIKLPSKVTRDTLKHFLEFGGFPEPFLKGNKRFYNKWRSLRTEQLIYEDLREFSNIKEIASIEILAEIMRHQAGQLVNYSSISKDLNNSVDTVKRWFTLLERLYYSFTIRPYFSNIPKSLRKQPKVYLWDWSYVADEGAKRENMIASHLLKAVHFWTDNGLGSYNLYFLRDKVKREVDFLVTKNEKPWILVEVKSSERKSLSPHLNYFNNLLNPPFAFQIDFSSDYIDRDCFSESGPIKVPAATFLSQLV